MPVLQTVPTQWWGDFQIEHGTAGRWKVGPLTLWVQRLEGEWRVAWEHGADAPDQTAQIDLPAEIERLLDIDTALRFAVTDDREGVRLIPILADRPIVTRPERPFSVGPRQEITIYVSTPLWIRLEGAVDHLQLVDVPSHRLSDTWFGPSTMEGELCYHTRTFCRMRLANVPARSNRVLTAVTVDNDVESPLPLERIRLPTAFLSVFQSPDGNLWTENVKLRRTADGESAELSLEPHAWRRERTGSIAISSPRSEVPGNVVVRALTSWFGTRGKVHG